MPVITIAREYGAGGSSVAALLADELGADIVDRSLLADVARRASLPPEEVASEDERGHTLLDRITRAFVPLGDAVASGIVTTEDLVDNHALIVAATREALRAVARSGNVVIIGRGSAAELRDARDACHVFLWAPLADRIRAVREREGCDEGTARHRIHELDAARAAYVHEVYGVDWRDRSLYDLVLNTARLGHRGAAQAILGAVAARGAVAEGATSRQSIF
jgi:cytidylate kinase